MYTIATETKKTTCRSLAQLPCKNCGISELQQFVTDRARLLHPLVMLMKRNNATSITFDGVPTQVEATLRQQIASSKTGSPNPVTSLENAREKVQVIAELVKAGEASARVALLAMSQEWVASHLDSKSIVIDHECEQGIARGVEAIEASFEELSKEIEGLKKKATGAGIVDSAV